MFYANATRSPGTTGVCFSVVTINDEHRKPEFKIKRRVEFKEGSGLKATGRILLDQDAFAFESQDGFESDSPERKS